MNDFEESKETASFIESPDDEYDHWEGAEWIDDFCQSDDNEPVRMKCTRCGHEEDIPKWLVGEVADAMAASGKDGKEVSFECPQCRGHMKIKR